MKKYLMLPAMLLLLAACKKNTVTERADFGRTVFVNATALKESPFAKYQNVAYTEGTKIVSPLGDQQFSFYKRNGEKLLDTVLKVTNLQSYYLYQPDTTIAAVIRTELPPPPPPPVKPADPLGNETPAPDGYLKLNFSNKLAFLTGTEKVDIEILTTVTGATTYSVVGTVYNVGPDFQPTAFLLQRAVRNDLQQTLFRFQFLKAGTREYLMTKTGTVYQTGTKILARTAGGSLFAIQFNYQENEFGTIEKNGKTYTTITETLYLR